MDAAQGVEAQTLANASLAVDNRSTLFLSSTRSTCERDSRECKRQIEEIIGLDSSGGSPSAKEGTVRARFLRRSWSFHPPQGSDGPLKALIFVRGTTPIARGDRCQVIDGVMRPKMKVRLMARRILRGGPSRRFRPSQCGGNGVGEVGFLSQYQARRRRELDTVRGARRPCSRFRIQRMSRWLRVYVSRRKSSVSELREALESCVRMSLIGYSPNSAPSFVPVRFLGMLHREIVQTLNRVQHGSRHHGPGVLRVTQPRGGARCRQSANFRRRPHRQTEERSLRDDPDAVGSSVRSCSLTGQAGISKAQYLVNRVLVTYELPFNG